MTTLHDCPTCTCIVVNDEVVDPLALPMPAPLWVLWAVLNDIPCEHCGSVPFDRDGDHNHGCPTLDTCAQTDPHLRPPWHQDASYTQGGPNWGKDHEDHLQVFHSHPEARTMTRMQWAQMVAGA